MILSWFQVICGDSKSIQGASELIWSDYGYVKIWLSDRQVGQKIEISNNEEVGHVSMKM